MPHQQTTIHLHQMPSNSKLITNFSNLSNQKWQIVNDGVMGGKSNSQFQINSDGNAVFIGSVSLQNGGGFASVKNREPINLDGFQTVRLNVLGDGKKYSFRLQTGDSHNIHPWSYEHRFDTKKDLWMEINLPIQDFKATYRGTIPKNALPLNATAIQSFGFLISDEQEGDFRLEIGSIEAL